VTTSDFTVKLFIPKEAYRDFCSPFLDRSFKEYLRDSIIDQMTNDQSPPVSIASIHIAYDNKELIEMLDERGNLLVAEDQQGVKKIEAKIIDKINQNFEKFSTPVAAFVIFETEENRNRCIGTFGTTASEVTGNLEINKSG
jgi:hypothetical protein